MQSFNTFGFEVLPIQEMLKASDELLWFSAAEPWDTGSPAFVHVLLEDLPCQRKPRKATAHLHVQC